MALDREGLQAEGSAELKEHIDGGGKVTRRKFLKILGASSALGVAGCADNADQKVFPFVKGDVDQIPGVAVWYHSTCTECTAGCGIQVRTREGRAVKVEGNPNHPVNKGGLCALGQSALQSHYDPDRVRQPLKRSTNERGETVFEPVGWDVVYGEIAKALQESSKSKALVTGEVSGALEDLMRRFCKDSFQVEHVVFDSLQPTSLARACELTFGAYGIPRYALEKAEVIVNFGADFMETWVSPVEMARGWSHGRRTEKPVKVVHIEPRLSLTGASADEWLKAYPGTEVQIALAILKGLLAQGRGKNLSDDVLAELHALVKGVSAESAAVASGVPQEKILLMIELLNGAKRSVVLSGGAAAATMDPLPLHVAVNFINAVLENVNETVLLSQMRVPRTSLAKVKELISSMKESKVGLVCVGGANPVFTLPADMGFEYALKNVPLVVSFSSHLDETARLAHYILPASSSLESWGDVRPFTGNASLIQPAMLPIFDTRPLGDILLQIASKAGKKMKLGSDEVKDFQAYLKASWKEIHSSSGVGDDFERFWLECVERGGYFRAPQEERPKVKIDRAVFKEDFLSASFGARGAEDSDLVLFLYPSVKSFDGRAANRPWLQELADPLTQVVWDMWAEIHPDTASKFNLERGDLITVGNDFGNMNLPVYVTPYVSPHIIAVPMGQGHSAYGRFAQQVGEGVPTTMLIAGDVPKGSGNVALVSTRVKIARARGRAKLVTVQGSDSQQGRELARTVFAAAVSAATEGVAANGGKQWVKEEGHGGEGHHEHAHHAPKQMYTQREHPIYEWGMAVDLSACTGCSACVVACYAENNIPVVGKQQCSKGREMTWLRIERYHDGTSEEAQVSFLPMMCQQCHNAPCEPVCPVYATYHNEEGLNAMIYNRCVGTRYCSNNCSYKVRRFNWYEYREPEPLTWQLNPDVTKRIGGMMEKCTFCVQRIVEAKDRAKDLGRLVQDGEVQPACVQSCPTKALTFGNLKDPNSAVSHKSHDKRAYKVLDHHLNTQPAVSYLERIRVEI